MEDLFMSYLGHNTSDNRARASNLATAVQISAMAAERGREFDKTEDVECLNEAIEMALLSNDMSLGEGVYQVSIMIDYCIWLGKRFMCTQPDNQEDLMLAINTSETILDMLAPGDTRARSVHLNLSGFHYLRLPLHGDTGVMITCTDRPILDLVIKYTTLALTDFPADYPLPVKQDAQMRLAVSLGARYAFTNKLEDLNSALKAAEDAVRGFPRTYPAIVPRYKHLSSVLISHAKHTGDVTSLNKAMKILEKELQVIPAYDAEKFTILSNMSVCYGRRYEMTSSLADLDKAIELAEEVELGTAAAGLGRSDSLHLLATWLSQRYNASGMFTDGERAIRLGEQSLSLDPEDHRKLHMVASALRDWFQANGNEIDLNRSIELFEKACEILPREASDRPGTLDAFSKSLQERFTIYAKAEDINRAVDLAKEALELTLPDNYSRGTRLETYGLLLGDRFDFMGDTSDINQAIEALNEAVRLTPAGDSTTHRKIGNLANFYGSRSDGNGNMDDLNKAIELCEKAWRTCPKGHRDTPRYLSNLGKYLGKRYIRNKELEDLNQAIKQTKAAVQSAADTDINKAFVLNNLSAWYGVRYERLGSRNDLDESIKCMTASVKMTRKTHIHYPLRVSNLAAHLQHRYELDPTSNYADLDTAIEYAEGALLMMPDSHPNKCDSMNNIGVYLLERYESDKPRPDDLDRAIKYLSTAANNLGADSQNSDCLWHLGMAYESRGRRTGDIEDKVRATELYAKGLNATNAPPSKRISAGSRTGHLLASADRWQEATDAFERVIDLFPLLSPRALSRSAQQHVLKDIANITSPAVSAALNSSVSLSDALSLLERGRGVIASHLLEMRTDLSTIDPKLAFEFLRAQEALKNISNEDEGIPVSKGGKSKVQNWVSGTTGRYDAEKALRTVIAKIQSDPNSKNFLGSVTRDDIVKAAGDDTIVVINVSFYRCDAFLIDQEHGIRIVELKNLNLRDIAREVNTLRVNRPRISRTLLGWLWTAIAEPILSELDFQYPPKGKRPTVIWIPTGALTHLPLHAAGMHTRLSGETVMDRVESSYSFSLRTLIHSRLKKASPRNSRPGSLEQNALLVEMSHTSGSGFADLPSAAEEVDRLKDICPLLNLKPVKLKAPQRKTVLDNLASCTVFHFAGHGQTHPTEPANSGLVLADGVLSVANLQENNLHERSPFLAYLSACLTGANDVNQLADEGIHLINACQLAGFRHVIGTMWQVSDQYCVDVAENVYKGIARRGLTDESVRDGFHETLLAARDAWVAQLLRKDKNGKTLGKRINGRDVPHAGEEVEATETNMKEPEVLDNLPRDVGCWETNEDEVGEGLDQLDLNDNQREPRNAKVMSTPRSRSQLIEANWVPYIHYGP